MRPLSTTQQSTKKIWWNRMSMCSLAKQVLLEDVLFYEAVETEVSRLDLTDYRDLIVSDIIVSDIDFYYGYDKLTDSTVSRVTVRLTAIYDCNVYSSPIHVVLKDKLMERFIRRLEWKYNNQSMLEMVTT